MRLREGDPWQKVGIGLAMLERLWQLQSSPQVSDGGHFTSLPVGLKVAAIATNPKGRFMNRPYVAARQSKI